MERLFPALLRFFGGVASALTGLGAICTAAGFLAERTRWNMLGLGTVGVDINEYVYTGSRFLAFLPGIFLTTALSVVTGSGLIFLAVLSLPALALGVRAFLRRPAGARLSQRIARRAAARRPALLGAGLAALALLQFAGTLFLFRAAGIRNLLFTDGVPGGGCAEPGLALATQIRLGCEARLDQAMGEVFLVVVAAGLLFWLALRALRGEAHGAGTHVLVGVNASLLVAQLVLLPINYGVLFLRNDFPVVQVALQEGAAPSAGPADGRYHLLQRRGDEFYLYSRAKARVWLVPRGSLASVVYLGICPLFGRDGSAPPGTCDFGGAP